jgi:hypothetical protein
MFEIDAGADRNREQRKLRDKCGAHAEVGNRARSGEGAMKGPASSGRRWRG